MSRKLSPVTALLLTVPPLMWAGNAVVGRMVSALVPPITLNFLRWAIAFFILLPLAAWVLRRGSGLWSHWRRFTVLSLLGVGCYNALQYLALQTSTPLNVTLVAAFRHGTFAQAIALHKLDRAEFDHLTAVYIPPLPDAPKGKATLRIAFCTASAQTLQIAVFLLYINAAFTGSVGATFKLPRKTRFIADLSYGRWTQNSTPFIAESTTGWPL